MKRSLLVVALLAVILVIFYFFNKKEVIAPVVTPPALTDTKPVELCFGLFTPANERGFSDKYTLRMSLDNAKGKVTGELDFLPGEKDSKTGKFEGTVTPVDKVMMARTIEAWWDTLGEGISAKEKIKIIFGEGTATIGAFGLSLTDVACSDLTLRDNIESYLKTNISKLSPVKPVLGGTWHVIGVSTDLSKSSGIVVYEDGHIQEKKNFSFSADAKGEITSLIIK